MSNKEKIGYRPTWAEVNLGNLAHNFRQVKSLLDKRTKILVTVKADAYGHGLVPVSERLASCGLDYLGVASIDEGIKLRRAGIKMPILVLGVTLEEDIEPFFTYRLTPSLCDRKTALAMNARAQALKKKIPVHIKVDTGMGRIGIMVDKAFDFISGLSCLSNLIVEGVFTHFALADCESEFTAGQIERFDRLVGDLQDTGIRIPLVHAANSAGLVNHPNSHFTMVRPGLVIYGLRPSEDLGLDLKPVLSLKTRVVFKKQVGAGYGISYGLIYRTKNPACIVTLPIGYGDGYPRNLSNLAPLLIGTRRFKVSGRICMDQIMVDTGSYRPRIGQEVVLIGGQGQGRVTAEELAALAGTISYEIVCGLGSRIPRVYLE
ncbi:MAG: alanine racemase [Candidatus Omnitrophica bacterium]|nr:alanine racemase [Candidatus Omnitrophota bacterium]